MKLMARMCALISKSSLSFNIILTRNYLCAPMSVYFNAYRDNAYNRGGEEILKVITGVDKGGFRGDYRGEGGMGVSR